jgi:hypothetical protein
MTTTIITYRINQLFATHGKLMANHETGMISWPVID